MIVRVLPERTPQREMIEMDQGNEQIDFGGAWQTLIFWICNFDFANPPMASRLQATAKSAGMHMAAAEAGDLGDFCTDFVQKQHLSLIHI